MPPGEHVRIGEPAPRPVVPRVGQPEVPGHESGQLRSADERPVPVRVLRPEAVREVPELRAPQLLLHPRPQPLRPFRVHGGLRGVPGQRGDAPHGLVPGEEVAVERRPERLPGPAVPDVEPARGELGGVVDRGDPVEPHVRVVMGLPGIQIRLQRGGVRQRHPAVAAHLVIRPHRLADPRRVLAQVPAAAQPPGERVLDDGPVAQPARLVEVVPDRRADGRVGALPRHRRQELRDQHAVGGRPEMLLERLPPVVVRVQNRAVRQVHERDVRGVPVGVGAVPLPGQRPDVERHPDRPATGRRSGRRRLGRARRGQPERTGREADQRGVTAHPPSSRTARLVLLKGVESGT